ncbi:MAG: DUF2155 domain-containing protein [Alphaproteobacteria bacterium]
MRRLFLSLPALCLLALSAPASAANIIGDVVVLRTLDKVTATTQDYTVKVGENLTYGSLTVDVKHCEKKPPEETPETYAFLQIFDKTTDGAGEETEPLKLFSGWMLASKPAISALDHPVYDVWVIDCKAKK